MTTKRTSRSCFNKRERRGERTRTTTTTNVGVTSVGPPPWSSHFAMCSSSSFVRFFSLSDSNNNNNDECACSLLSPTNLKCTCCSAVVWCGVVWCGVVSCRVVSSLAIHGATRSSRRDPLVCSAPPWRAGSRCDPDSAIIRRRRAGVNEGVLDQVPH